MSNQDWSTGLICIRQEKHLARHLGLDLQVLRHLAESGDSYCEELLLHDPAKPDKDRQVVDVTGPLRRAQKRIQRTILLPKLVASAHSFGGVRGRHIKMNAEKHMRSQFAFTCDITDFYPSIHSKRLYKFLVEDQGCSPDVARLLTRLCTHRHHLALGLITSPLLAEQFLKPVDKRIARMAKEAGIEYTRYVDDITLSGPFDLRRSGFPGTIKSILKTYGFAANNAKDQFGRIGEPEVLITKLRVNRGHLDVSRKYYDELCRSLHDLRSLGVGGDFLGPYYTNGQMWGRVEFVSWVNHGRRRQLRRLFGLVNWSRARDEAFNRSLAVSRKMLKPLRSDVFPHEAVVEHYGT